MSDICVQTKVHNAYAGTYESPQPYWQEIPNLPLSAKLEFDTIFEAVIEDRRNCAYRIGKLDKTHAWYANAPKVTRGKGIGVGNKGCQEFYSLGRHSTVLQAEILTMEKCASGVDEEYFVQIYYCSSQAITGRRPTATHSLFVIK